MFRAVDRSPGLHQGLLSRVSVGTHSWDQAFTVSGRLVDSCLFGAGSQAGRPVPALALSHPWDCDKRDEVRSCALTDCEVPWYDHRYQGRIFTCIRTCLVRGGALTSSIKTCPGCGRTRRSCCTSIFSR